MKMYHKKLKTWMEVYPVPKEKSVVFISESGAEFHPDELGYPETASVQKANVQAVGIEVKVGTSGSLDIKKPG